MQCNMGQDRRTRSIRQDDEPVIEEHVLVTVAVYVDEKHHYVVPFLDATHSTKGWHGAVQ